MLPTKKFFHGIKLGKKVGLPKTHPGDEMAKVSVTSSQTNVPLIDLYSQADDLSTQTTGAPDLLEYL